MSEQHVTDLSNDTQQVPDHANDYTPSNDTERSLLDMHIDRAIEAQDGPSNAPAPTATPAATPGKDPKQAAQQGQPNGDGTGKPVGANPVAQQQPQAPGPDAGASKHRRDAKGNVIDDKGNIIAAAGPERRHFERAERLQRHAETLTTQVQNLERQIAESSVLGNIPKQLGLQAEEVNMGLQIVANFKRDPLATLKYLLTETAAMGHNVNQLLGQPGGVDMGAIARMIDQRLGPIQQDREQAVREHQVRQAAEAQYNAFMAEHEFAGTHETAIARLMQSNPRLTPEAAYLQLENFSLRNGLDFSQPLEPQLLAREQGGTQQPTAQGVTRVTPQPAQTQKPIPPMPGRGGNAPVTTNARIANEGDSWSDIIGTSMREAGYRV